VNKTELVEQIAAKADLSRREAESAVEAALNTIEEQLARGGEITLTVGSPGTSGSAVVAFASSLPPPSASTTATRAAAAAMTMRAALRVFTIGRNLKRAP